MKASEVRIGNIVSVNTATGGWWVDHVVSRNDFMVSCAGTLMIEGMEPIKLTEEWLVKFGFRKVLSWYIVFGRYKNETLEITYNNDTDESQYYVYVRGLLENEFVQIKHDLKYVHQLQNLYFALTGEELNIKK